MDSAAPQSGFSSLLPGTLYTISVVATAGDKSAPPILRTAATAPSSVHGLQVASSSSDSLSVSWWVGPGRAERFRVLLTDQDSVLLKNVTLLNTATSAELRGLQPGTPYTVTVVTEAVGLQSSTSKQAVTVPAPVSDLRLENVGNSDFLQASWHSPAGGVDTYLLTLSAVGSPPQEHRLPPNATRAEFEGLTSGRSYLLRVRTSYGGLSSETTTSARTVPQPVSSLAMAPLSDGRTLMLHWAPPTGDWEKYGVLLRNASEVLLNRTVSKLTRQLAISARDFGLLPGRRYEAEVTVHSGVLGNTARCIGRLAPGPVQQLLVRHVDETSLSVRWGPPLGDWDSFTALLKEVDPATTAAQRVVSWEAREVTFNGLTSGRLYAVTVTTHSGNLSSSASVTART
ncbi:receptor-type tyrosine-protein phosphatase beta-like, partial [Plectropomus leopardus]|uniref:receptor-type tyrosine-protein phosphatase beta-like n=1 Tax=Plectropomus leopardus TaxID=160734 RepID=UPI001C4CA301